MLALTLPKFIDDFLPWLVAGAIVLIGLVIYGYRDLLRFSLKRTWAISSVVFAESIRRRVLWITPLAILGVIVVSQLQKPIDEQDAIRQTTKFCVFASGLLVTITAIILACTNLPREIESRVIYTVVTKPITRLEIVLGKVLGFARVSAAILLIMGAFSLGYLQLRAWNMQKFITQRLEDSNVDPMARSSLEYYKTSGLLAARVYDQPDELQVYARQPNPDDPKHWMAGGEGNFMVPFAVSPDDLFVNGDPEKPVDLAVAVQIGFAKNRSANEASDAELAPTTLPWLIQSPTATPEQVRVGPPVATAAPAGINVGILDPNLSTLVESRLINGGKSITLEDNGQAQAVIARIAPEGITQLAKSSLFFVQISAGSGFDYSAGAMPVVLLTSDGRRIEPMRDPHGAAEGRQFALPIFRTQVGTYGQQLRGGDIDPATGVYKFRNAPNSVRNGLIPFELKLGIERSDYEPGQEQPTKLEIVVRDRKQGSVIASSQPLTVFPETNRTSYFTVPGSTISGGDFDVVVRCLTPGHYVGLSATSLRLVADNENFAWNLCKSMLVLWLLALLVVIVSVFSSTFVSWPIAIVLTILILLAHWGVQQLGDATAPGIGNLVVTDLFKTSDPNVASALSRSVEGLSGVLRQISKILPDISQFSAIEDLERGVAIPASRLSDGLRVIGIFGLPLLVLAYVFLRGKEVAP